MVTKPVDMQIYRISLYSIYLGWACSWLTLGPQCGGHTYSDKE